MTKSTNVTTTTNAFSMDLPVHLQNQGAGRGNEEVDTQDLTIPRLQIIQALSDQRKKKSASYIEGADEGMSYNTATGELFEAEVYIIPVYFKKEFLVWTKVVSSDGFRGSFNTELEAVNAIANATDEKPEDLYVSETHQQYCLLIDPTTKATQEIVLSMKSSQIKVSKKLNTQVRINGGDRFSNVYVFTPVEESGKKGDYFNWSFKKAGYTPEEAFKNGEAMYDSISAGEKTVTREQEGSVKEEKVVNPTVEVESEDSPF